MNEELITKILFAMGLESGDIPENVINHYLTEWLIVYPDNTCLAIYNTIASLYEWLIKSSAVDGSGGGSYSEKIGGVTVSANNYNKGVDWENAYDIFLDNPTAALPSCRDVLKKSPKSGFIINGTSVSEVERIRNNPDSNTAYKDKSPYSPRTPDERKDKSYVGFKF
tara:strand:+ start:33811 stop:34311 length:501 start_codon:yes stop_codon:yes gene_type:complete